jgi:hypothetical protein
MLRWLHEDERKHLGIQPRPIVYIEDKIKHVFKLLEALRNKQSYEGEVFEGCTIMLLAPPGPDTKRDIVELLSKYSDLQVAAVPAPGEPNISLALIAACSALRSGKKWPSDEIGVALREHAKLPGAETVDARFGDLERVVLYEDAALKAAVDRLVRPGGLVVCDLEQLALDHKSSDVRAQLMRAPVAAGKACAAQEEKISDSAGQEPASLSVLSEMRVFLSVGSALRAQDVDIREELIFDKENMYGGVSTAIADKLRTRFPWKMKLRHAQKNDTDPGMLETHRVGEGDRAFLNWCLDLVLWPCQARGKVSGRTVTEEEGEFGYTSVPAETLHQLVDAHLLKRGRKAVVKQDIRSGAQNPESVIRTIKNRLVDGVIPNGADGKYELNPKLTIASCDVRNRENVGNV